MNWIFTFPPELIAQEPPAQRTAARLLHYHRDTRQIVHRQFRELPSLLREGDLLVFNDTRVLPARFNLRKETGGLVEGLFLEELSPGDWRVLLRNLGSAPSQTRLHFESDEREAIVIERREAGEFLIRLDPPDRAEVILARIGRMPLPPYIKRDRLHDARDESDRERYQTVFARAAGAVAAPTAALHFTQDLLSELAQRNVERAFVTLHVGLGTFKPVTAEQLEAHPMHRERYTISAAAAAQLDAAKREGRRIIAVGTTSARVLESQQADESFEERSAETEIFIYPPYRWKHVDSLITNFHLPRSTLIALVAALTGLDEQRRVYQAAIEAGYRFFSYGDAMWIE